MIRPTNREACCSGKGDERPQQAANSLGLQASLGIETKTSRRGEGDAEAVRNVEQGSQGVSDGMGYDYPGLVERRSGQGRS